MSAVSSLKKAFLLDSSDDDSGDDDSIEESIGDRTLALAQTFGSQEHQPARAACGFKKFSKMQTVKRTTKLSRAHFSSASSLRKQYDASGAELPKWEIISMQTQQTPRSNVEAIADSIGPAGTQHHNVELPRCDASPPPLNLSREALPDESFFKPTPSKLLVSDKMEAGAHSKHDTKGACMVASARSCTASSASTSLRSSPTLSSPSSSRSSPVPSQRLSASSSKSSSTSSTSSTVALLSSVSTRGRLGASKRWSTLRLGRASVATLQAQHSTWAAREQEARAKLLEQHEEQAVRAQLQLGVARELPNLWMREKAPVATKGCYCWHPAGAAQVSRIPRDSASLKSPPCFGQYSVTNRPQPASVYFAPRTHSAPMLRRPQKMKPSVMVEEPPDLAVLAGWVLPNGDPVPLCQAL